MCKIQAPSRNKMRVLTALLDFPNAGRAEVSTDRLSRWRRNASLRLTGKCSLEGRCLTIYALVSQTNNHEETVVAIAMRGADGQETSCNHASKTDCCLLSRSILVAPSSHPQNKTEHGLLQGLAEDCRTKYPVFLAIF